MRPEVQTWGGVRFATASHRFGSLVCRSASAESPSASRTSRLSVELDAGGDLVGLLQPTNTGYSRHRVALMEDTTSGRCCATERVVIPPHSVTFIVPCLRSSKGDKSVTSNAGATPTSAPALRDVNMGRRTTEGMASDRCNPF